MKTIVVSGITLRKGGTLAILRDALAYLSELAASAEWRVVALVNRKELCYYPNIEYMEVPLKGWVGRLWYEYVTMHRISKQIGPVHLWLSMHDVTPRVEATYQAVYCQTSFPFYRWKWRDFRFDPKIPIFAMLTRFYYRFRVHKNRYLIVQQEWLREGLSKMLGVDEEKFIVFPPRRNEDGTPSVYKKGRCAYENVDEDENEDENEDGCCPFTFLFASTADCHKNFETLCEAARLLEQEVGAEAFRVILTMKGNENKYARWIKRKWGEVVSIDFRGLMSRETLEMVYKQADCLVFPSNIETWGLPISEYMEANGGPMILSDLPYAHNTSRGGSLTAFFEPDNAFELKTRMKEAMLHEYDNFPATQLVGALKGPKAESWEELIMMCSVNEDRINEDSAIR